jgi:hypothetical protein
VETQPKIWRVAIPSQWAKQPEFMNIHYLLEAERCPRAVALKRADYAELWRGKGYPDRPTQHAVIGRLVHSTIQEIIGKLIEANCESIHDPDAVAQLKQIGGYSGVIFSKIQALLGALEGNPRMLRSKDRFANELKSSMPQVREQVQIMLSRLSWKHRQIAGRSSAGVEQRSGQKGKRAALAEGAYCEVDLIDQDSMWKGFADLIEIRKGVCAITDFKSGSRSATHDTQLLVYAWLWRSDKERNPEQRPATSLTLSYQQGEVEVTIPPVEKLDVVIQDLRDRTTAVRSAMANIPPQAKVDFATCRECSVRLLCDEYWHKPRPSSLSTGSASKFDDVEVMLIERQTNRTWEAECRVSGSVPTKRRRVLIRLSESDFGLEAELKAGNVVRFADAYVLPGGEDEMPTVQITSHTEPMFVSR